MRLKRWLIQKLGGYPDTEAFIDGIDSLPFQDRHAILTRAVRRLFNTLDQEDILSQNSAGQWMCEGKVLSEGQKKQIISEAQMIINTYAWKVLQADVKYKVNKMMFLDATNEQHLASGKLWLHMLNVFGTRLKSLTEGTGHFNTEVKKTTKA